MKHKICSYCKKYLPITEFGCLKGGKFGVRANCRKCCVIQATIYFHTHREQRKEYIKKYTKEKPWIATLSNIRSRCKHEKWYKNIKCLLTSKDLEFLWKRDNADKLLKPSIDRINSKGHYTLENCRFIEQTKNVRGEDLFKRKSKYEIYLNKTFDEMQKETGLCVVSLHQRIRKYGSYKLPPRNLRLPDKHISPDIVEKVEKAKEEYYAQKKRNDYNYRGMPT